MSYKILEQNGVENEVVDGGAMNNFCAGNRDGIIAGVLSECALSAAGNGVAISPGLLIICGVRIKITASETLYVSSVPLKATRYQIIAQVTLGADGNTSAEFFLQSNASLKRDAIYAQGYGTYQEEIGSFTHNPDGSISDMVRTLDVLYGGGNGSANIEVGNVVTQTLPAGQDAEFDMTARNENGKTIFDVKALIPRGASGTDEEAVHFTPQTLTEAQKTQARANINALSSAEADIQQIAVDCDHEYEITGYTGHEWSVAVPDHCQLTVTKIKGQTRRKSLNLLKLSNYTVTWNGLTFNINNGILTINGTVENGSIITFDNIGTLYPNRNYTFGLYSNSPSPLSSGVYLYKSDSVQTIYAYIGTLVGGAYNFTVDDIVQYKFGMFVSGGQIFNNVVLKPILVEGTYTAETMPAYQPYNNTLVNSKVKNLLSTGKNLLDLPATIRLTSNGVTLSLNNGVFTLTGTASGNAQFCFDLNKILTTEYPVPLTLSRSTGWTGNVILQDVDNNNVIGLGYNTTSGTVTSLNANATKIYFDVKSGEIVNLQFTIMLNYGSSALPYKPYISDDTFGVDKEITQFGEIDNLSKQFTDYGSEIITLNGDENWQENTVQSTANTKLYFCSLGGSATGNEGADNYYNEPANGGVFANDIPCWGIDNGTNVFYRVSASLFPTVQSWITYLQSNPIQLIYRLATPRIQTTVDIPAGYSAHKGGLQQQVIEGDYLPYIITKDYPVSGAAQILKNLEIDRDQGKMLDAIRQGALPVGKLANAITIISGDTKKTFDGSTPVEITASGEAGPPGEQGEQGVPGEAATITIRNVDVGTALPGQPASVVIKNVGTSTNAILDFGFMIPRGEPGEQGEQGNPGQDGTATGYKLTISIINPEIAECPFVNANIIIDLYIPEYKDPSTINNFDTLKAYLGNKDTYTCGGVVYTGSKIVPITLIRADVQGLWLVPGSEFGGLSTAELADYVYGFKIISIQYVTASIKSMASMI